MTTDTDTTPCPAALAAAAWWANQLNGDAAQDAGDGGINGMYALLKGSLSTRHPVDRVEAFGASLAHRIAAELERRSWGVTIGVDYGPDPILQDAAADAGIRLGMADLPIKTVMWVKPDEVAVAAGYSADRETIFAEASEETA
jgi:hypothetical protein